MTLFAIKMDDLLAAMMSSKSPAPMAGGSGAAAGAKQTAAELGLTARGTPISGCMQPVYLGQTRIVAYYRTPGNVPVVDISGPLSFAYSWCCTPTALVCESIRQAADEPGPVMLIDLHCPGGESFGLSDIHAALKYARSKKMVVGVAHDKAFSLGAIILQMCDRRYMTPSSIVGSIGVAFALQDSSKAEEMNGYRQVVIAEPEGKADSLSSAVTARSEANFRVLAKRYFELICSMIGPTSGLSAADVRTLNAQDFAAADAVAARLADEVIEYDQLLALLDKGAPALAARPDPAGSSSQTTDPQTGDPQTGDPQTGDCKPKADEDGDEDQTTEMDGAEAPDEDEQASGVSPDSHRKGTHMPDLNKTDPKSTTDNKGGPTPASLQELFDEFKGKPDGLAFIEECQAAKLPIGECHKRWGQRMEAKAAETAAQLATKTDKDAKLSTLPKGSGAIVAENQTKDADGNTPAPYASFEIAVRAVMADERLDKAAATREVIRRHPQLHKKMLDENTSERAIEPCERITVRAC